MARLILFLAFLIVPAIEIALFIVVGEAIGILPTIALVFLTALAGTMLLREQGLGVLRRVQDEVRAERVPAEELGTGLTLIIAAFLLIVPGFFTDTIGLLLFVPAVRRLLWRRMRQNLGAVVVTGGPGVRGGSGGGPGAGRPGQVIDLEEGEFGPAREESPWRDPGRE